MSALEQEPILVTGMAVAVAPSTLTTIPIGGVVADTPLSAVQQKYVPWKAVRVRGMIWVTGTASILSVYAVRGGPAGSQVLQTMQQPGTAAVGVPLCFEWLDTTPNITIGAQLFWVINGSGSVATTASAIFNVTCYNG